MNLVPAMWAVWIALFFSLAVLKIYVSRLSRDEDDELVLGKSFEHIRVEQASIMAKLERVEPVQRAIVWVFGATSLLVAAYYVHDMVSQFK